MTSVIQRIVKVVLSFLMFMVLAAFLYATVVHRIIDFLSTKIIMVLAEKMREDPAKGAGVGLGMTVAAHISIMFCLYFILSIIIWFMVHVAEPLKYQIIYWPIFIKSMLLFTLYGIFNIPGFDGFDDMGITSLGQTGVLIRILVLLSAGPLLYFLALGTRRIIELLFDQTQLR